MTIPVNNNKNSYQKLQKIRSHHLLYQRTQKREGPRYLESQLHARKATTKELKTLNLCQEKKLNSF